MEEWENGVGRDKGMSDEDKSGYCPVLVATLLWRLSELPTLHLYAQPKLQGWLERIGTMKMEIYLSWYQVVLRGLLVPSTSS